MGITTHRVRVFDARRIKHPVYPQIEKHYLIVKASELPDGIRKDANAREATGLNRQVYRDVQRSLLGQDGFPGIFDLKNKGIVILADAVKKVADDVYELVIQDGQGIVDGGHTYEIITRAQGLAAIPDDAHVEVQVRTGVDPDLITEISAGLNTGIAVKAHSIANLDRMFDWIKEEVADMPYGDKIAWRESDAGEYDVRDLIAVLECMNVIDFPNDSGAHPLAAYEGIRKVTAKFVADAKAHEADIKASTYHRLRPLLKDALFLFDTIRRDFREAYNRQAEGNAGNLDIMEKAAEGRRFKFLFTGAEPSEFRLTKGGLFPIFAAFRTKVRINPATNDAEWDGGFRSVLDLWEKTKGQLARDVKAAIKDVGHKPDMQGKSRGHWSSLHKTVELQLLRGLRG